MKLPLLLLPALAALALLAAAPALAAEKKPHQAMEDVRILSAADMEGRFVGSLGGARARTYLLGRLQALGLEPVGASFEHPFTAERKNQPLHGVNLVGKIAGTAKSDRVLLIVAHYDHLGVRDGKIYHGADDNASGVAGLLAIAQSFRDTPPRHTVLFALVDGEEGGMFGSKAFTAAPPVPLARIAFVLNMDMISKNAAGELYAAGAHHFPWLKPRLDRLAREVPVTLKQGHDGPPWKGSDEWTEHSDHYPFHQKGVPWVYFGVEDHPEYHQPTDQFTTVPEDFFLRSVSTVVTAARRFDHDLEAIARDAGR